MTDLKTCLAILETIHHPIVFADNDHIIRYLNKAARKRYYEERGFSDLIGKSLLDCHNPASVKTIKILHKRLQQGKDEIFIRVTERGERKTLVAVRDEAGALIGYYERFEMTGLPGKPTPNSTASA
jgi:DUF438 domain-containing protein